MYLFVRLNCSLTEIYYNYTLSSEIFCFPIVAGLVKFLLNFTASFFCNCSTPVRSYFISVAKSETKSKDECFRKLNPDSIDFD